MNLEGPPGQHALAQHAHPQRKDNGQLYILQKAERRSLLARNDKIVKTLLHQDHRLGFGVWETSKGAMYVCGKGIGIGIRDQVVDTLFEAIKKATPAPNKLQQPADAFFGRGLTKKLLLSLVRCMGMLC